MKIGPGYFPLNNTVQRNETNARPAQTQNFGDFMKQSDEGRSHEELQRKLEDIRLQGDRLMRSMTVRELKLYRIMVKSFLEDTVKRGIGLKETKGWDRRGRGKRYKILEEVDTMLVAMGEELLLSEEGRLELLQKVGEIRGLLINLVF
ncbi:YaaR family protein [Cohnella nanjingensis]|uniref:YaaR family protein n=1 Tax=Cohnella nanjingensis TaxID=1387779 RepID=A0A7X0RWF7_9BACL|nr:YaaR family protein [Cohnella nanjingensis]MBB6674886.1 YaaR family protein [Cohnella nanjingensis]